MISGDGWVGFRLQILEQEVSLYGSSSVEFFDDDPWKGGFLCLLPLVCGFEPPCAQEQLASIHLLLLHLPHRHRHRWGGEWWWWRRGWLQERKREDGVDWTSDFSFPTALLSVSWIGLDFSFCNSFCNSFYTIIIMPPTPSTNCSDRSISTPRAFGSMDERQHSRYSHQLTRLDNWNRSLPRRRCMGRCDMPV